MTIDKKIYELRKRAGLSQNELADMLAVSRQSVSKWENGTSAPTYAKIQSLCEIFGVTAEYLMNDNSDEYIANDGPVTSKFVSPFGVVAIISAFVLALLVVLSMFVTAQKEIPVHYDNSRIIEIDGTAELGDFDGVEVVEAKGLLPFLDTYNLEVVFLLASVGVTVSTVGLIKQKRRNKNEKD